MADCCGDALPCDDCPNASPGYLAGRNPTGVINPNPGYTRAADICLHASGLVSGDRQRTHGDKLENHRNIAALWGAYLGISLTATQAALMLALLKIARTKTGAHNPDDYVDLCGYGGCAGEIADRERNS